MGFRKDAGKEEGVEGTGRAADAEVVELAEGAEGVVDHTRLAEKDDGMREEAVGAEVGAGLEVFKKGADSVEGLRIGEFGDGGGESDAVEMGVGSERGSSADIDDSGRIGFGFEKGDGRP